MSDRDRMNNMSDHDLLVETATMVKQMNARLFGNGQPGEITSIKRRLTKLEIALASAIGGGAVVIWLIERLH